MAGCEIDQQAVAGLEWRALIYLQGPSLVCSVSGAIVEDSAGGFWGWGLRLRGWVL